MQLAVVIAVKLGDHRCVALVENFLRGLILLGLHRFLGKFEQLVGKGAEFVDGLLGRGAIFRYYLIEFFLLFNRSFEILSGFFGIVIQVDLS